MQLPASAMKVVGEDATLLQHRRRRPVLRHEHALHRPRRGPRRAVHRARLQRPARDRPTTSTLGAYNTYLFKNRDSRRLTNDGASGLGGMVTEVRVYADALPPQTSAEPDLWLSTDTAHAVTAVRLFGALVAALAAAVVLVAPGAAPGRRRSGWSAPTGRPSTSRQRTGTSRPPTAAASSCGATRLGGGAASRCPGPVLCVNEGDTVTVHLRQQPPRAASRSSSPARRAVSASGGSARAVDPRGGADRRRRHLHLHGVRAGHLPVRERHRTRQAGADGPLRRAGRAPGRPSRLGLQRRAHRSSTPSASTSCCSRHRPRPPPRGRARPALRRQRSTTTATGRSTAARSPTRSRTTT